jgi:hypothetical protein
MYLSITEAQVLFNKSRSTIAKAIKLAAPKDLKQGKRLNTGLYKILVSKEYLNAYFPKAATTENIEVEGSSDYINTLKKQLDNQQKTIDKLLETNTAFLERQKELIENNHNLINNEERFQILLDRSNKRSNLLERHFDRNRKANPTPEDEIIEDIIEEAKEEEPKNINSIEDFNTWLNSMSKPH